MKGHATQHHRVSDYLANGGLFNPELMAHHEVRELVMALMEELTTAKKAYLDVADAVCRGSTGPEDVCRQARETRAKLSAAIDRIDELIDSQTKPNGGIK